MRWFGLVASDASREALQAADAPLGVEGGFLDPSDGQDESDMTPLQRATRMIDGQPPEQERSLSDDGSAQVNPTTVVAEEGLWQAANKIWLLDREQMLFENFLHRICPLVSFPVDVATGHVSSKGKPLMFGNSLIFLTQHEHSPPEYHTSPSGTQVC